MSICVENGKNIFITRCTGWSSKVNNRCRMCSEISGKPWKTVPSFFRAPEARAHTSTLQEAGEMMRSLSGYLQGTDQAVQTLLSNSKETNGPEGTVASKTIRSVNMINQGLARLHSNIGKINPELTDNPEAPHRESREPPRSSPFETSNMHAVTLR